jgi:hypothetical protein
MATRGGTPSFATLGEKASLVQVLLDTKAPTACSNAASGKVQIWKKEFSVMNEKEDRLRRSRVSSVRPLPAQRRFCL